MINDNDILSIDQVTYKYGNGNEPALHELDLVIKRGNFTSIMGKTGAGKTTLLMLLNGLIPHFFDGEIQGTVTTGRLNTQRYHIQTLARRVGLVLQDPDTQILGMTVEKDVAFGPCNLGFPPDKIRGTIPKVLDTVGLAGYENRIPARLSGGEKQRLAIAGVLAMYPLILALDEPTSELDPVSRRRLFDTCYTLCHSLGYTVICATHDSEEALLYSDNIVVLENGKIAWEGKPYDLFSDISLCKQSGIRPPAITEFLHELQSTNAVSIEEIPVTFNEGIDVLYTLLKGRPVLSPDRISQTDNNVQKETIIEVKNLYHRYEDGFEALHGISVNIKAGEFIALVGQNGAGKSTFVKHLNRLLLPTEGDVYIKGVNTKQSDTSTLGKTIGYVFQNPDHQIFSASVRDEIAFGLRHICGIDGAKANERITYALSFVGLQNKIDRHPFSLGKGERQKLAVASVLAVEPDVIVIDEPTTGLDWVGTQQMMKLIARLHSLGHTIIMITHDMQLAAEYAGRIIILNKGKVAADGIPEEVFLQNEILEQASLVPPPAALITNRLREKGINITAVRMSDLKERVLETLLTIA